MIERVWRCTWRPWSSEIGGVPGGGQSGGGSLRERIDMSSDSIHRSTCNCGNVENWVQDFLPRDWLGAGDSPCWDDVLRGECSTQWILSSVYAVLIVCCIRCMLYSVYAVLSVCCTRCMLYLVHAVLGACCSWCMLYSVYAVLSVCCTWCTLLIMAWGDREGWLNFVFLGDGTVDAEKDRDEMRWGKSL